MEKIISYYKERYEEESTRFSHLETKCSMFLSFLTALIGAIGAIGALNKNILSPCSDLGWFVFGLYITGTICIIVSWSFALASLKISNCPVMPKNRETLDYLLKVDTAQVDKHMLNCYIDTIEKLTIKIGDKAKYLRFSYNGLSTGAMVFGILAIISVILEVTK